MTKNNKILNDDNYDNHDNCRDDEMKKIINDTVTATIAKLKLSGLIRDQGLSAIQKTEQALKLYQTIKQNTDVEESEISKKFIARIEKAMEILDDDPYRDVISMVYFDGMTREQVAECFDTTVTTISRHKTRLIQKLTPILFSDETIIELFS